MLVRPRPHRETIGLQNVMICEPLELEYLSAALERAGHETEIVDMILERRSLRQCAIAFRPALVAVTGYIAHINVVKGYAAVLKELDSGLKIAVGGVHAQVCPEDWADPSIDFIITSGGSAALTALANALACGEEAPAEGLWQGEHAPHLPRPAVQEDVRPDRAKVERYRARYYYMFHRNCALMKTSYGCPYQCSFCFCRQVTGGTYLARPVEDVLDELETMPQTEIYLVDDDFLFGEDRLSAFCDGLENRGIRKKYLVYGRADFVAAHEELIARLKRNGLRAVIIGLESSDDEELSQYQKGSSTRVNEEAVAILKKYDVECYGAFILGLNWGKAEFRALERWIKKLGITFVNLQPLTPLKGTAEFARYQDRLLAPTSEFEKWDMAHLVVRPEKLSVRRYYWEMTRLYLRTMANPVQGVGMARRYGLAETLKLSWGAAKVSWQYVKKIVRGA